MAHLNNSEENRMMDWLILLSNLIILCSTPFITPYLIPHYSLVVAALLSVMILCIHAKHLCCMSDVWSRSLICCSVVAVLHGFLTFVLFYDEDGFMGFRNALGMGMRYLFILLTIPIIKYNYKRFHLAFWSIHSVIIFLSLLLFFLCFMGVYLPYMEFSPDGREHYFFYIGATNAIFEFGRFIFIRIAGYCDEPGRLALVLTYLLVLNEFTFKKNIIRIFLCLAGLLTFSAAFFITLVPIVFYWMRVRIINAKSILVSFTLVALTMFFLYKNVDVLIKDSINDAIELLITNRFERDGSSGKFQGDNRSDAIPYQLKAFEASPIVGVLGKGEDYMLQHKLGTSTFFSGLARYGIFDLFLYLPFVVLLVRYWKNTSRWLFVSIGLNFLQRPELEHMFFLIVLTLLYYNRLYDEENMRSAYMSQSTR